MLTVTGFSFPSGHTSLAVALGFALLIVFGRGRLRRPLLAFAIVVVATPRDAYPLFVAYAVLLAVVIGVSRVPATYLLKRTVVELPFVVFAVLLPFVATGPRTEVLGVAVSEHGLEAGVALLVKGTLGVLASLTLAATTEPQDLLVGLERLRLPQQLVQIMAFMVRYLDVVTDERAYPPITMFDDNTALQY